MVSTLSWTVCVVISAAAATRQTGIELAAQHGSHWSTPPVHVPGPGFPDGPIVGNGDLGITVSAKPVNGSIDLHLGLSQLWGIGAYKHPDNDPIDFPLPRRLGLMMMRSC